MSEAIAVLSQKGGTGKTTMVRSLADVFERLGMDVLAVDADPQSNLSDSFDADPNSHPTPGDRLQPPPDARRRPPGAGARRRRRARPGGAGEPPPRRGRAGPRGEDRARG